MKSPTFFRFARPLLCLLTLSCSALAEGAENEDVQVQDAAVRQITGSYVGPFGERKITIHLDRIIGDTITGYSVVAGNQRAFSGSWKSNAQLVIINAREPGDHEADGSFSMTFDPNDKTLAGVWTANDKRIGERKFSLKARNFVYNPKAGKFPQSSTRLLKETDVENLRQKELRIMRNEIYARHGYSFKMADMRDYFEPLDWYMPIAMDITGELTKIEKANAALIKRYETYADIYYDRFGR